MSRAAFLLLVVSIALSAEDPPAAEWNKDTVTPLCPNCTFELPIECDECPTCLPVRARRLSGRPRVDGVDPGAHGREPLIGGP